MDIPASDKFSIDKMAFDYAWGYFTVHAGQRMQSVNFFLLAAAFLVGAYVNAMANGHPGLAVGISLLGGFASLIFFRIERRVRELIHAAEAALRPIEEAMARRTEIPALRILHSVAAVTPGAWHYSKVFKMLYLAVGIGFVLAAIYAACVLLGRLPQVITVLPEGWV